eukprot:Lithocolla_globosa_v1_NODE_6718_length_1045_cov_15.526263.p1 type:complete len:311 gc:universal NODE_6718_length_1045_cov_15.526263:959-27(-)
MEQKEEPQKEYEKVVDLELMDDWQKYSELLSLLDRSPHLRDVRRDVACTMHLPNLMALQSPIVHKVPLNPVHDQSSLSDILFPSIVSNEDTVYTHNPLFNRRIHLWTGDIAKVNADAIVNAALPGLVSEGVGLTGYLNHLAGPKLRQKCFEVVAKRPCVIGDVVVTPAFDLPCKHIFHAVSPLKPPRSPKQDPDDIDLLQKCYEDCLDEAQSMGVTSLAFCCLGVGSRHSYPLIEATQMALRTVRLWMEKQTTDNLCKIVFVMQNARQQEVYEQFLGWYFPTNAPIPLETEVTDDQQMADLLSELPSPPS